MADGAYLTAAARARAAWLRGESLGDASTLPVRGVLATEIVEGLGAALARFAELATSLPVAAEGI